MLTLIAVALAAAVLMAGLAGDAAADTPVFSFTISTGSAPPWRPDANAYR